MSDEISTREVMRMIAQGLDEAETAIRSHPPETVGVYEKGVAAFMEGMDKAQDRPAPSDPNVTWDEMRVINRYMAAMSFMSAWYHLHGNKAQRDKAAQSAALLVSGTGLESTAVFQRFLRFEHLWRNTFKQEGLARAGCLGMLGVLLSPVWMS